MSLLDEFEKLSLPYRLKEVSFPYELKKVNRRGTVNQRPESVAEHVYSSLFLAKHFLPKVPISLNESKVTSMLLYHALPKVMLGDSFILDAAASPESISKSLSILKDKFPGLISKEVYSACEEYFIGNSVEAKFVKAIKALDPIVHSINIDEWKSNGFNESKLRELKEPLFKEFPVLLEFFNDLVKSLVERNLL